MSSISVVDGSVIMADEEDALDMCLAKRIGDMLESYYPGYPWAVGVNSEIGMVDVRCLNLSTQYGYMINMKDLYATAGWDIVKVAGGEILERFRVRRGRMDEAQVDAIRTVGGMKVFDASSLANNSKGPRIVDIHGNKIDIGGM
jgi:hypothetical protein